MPSITEQIEQRFVRALSALGEHVSAAKTMIQLSRDSRFDFQSNCVMGLAKRRGSDPHNTAEQLVDALDLGEISYPPEISGPGFINIRLKPAFLARCLSAIPSDSDLLRIDPGEPYRTIIVDYSQPNVAKEMHVGHLRSTIIGDAIARSLEFLGNLVIRHNHIGDWGTQFGMLIEHLRITQSVALDDPSSFRVGDLEEFYREAKHRFDDDPDFADAARRTVVDLQSGDAKTVAVWRTIVDESMRHCNEVYARLGVALGPEHIRGESFYNDDLPHVVGDLRDAGISEESDGAACVFLDGYKTRDGKPLPVIIQKADGGYLYATTDLAAIRYRVGTVGADRVIYVVDNRQKLHFRQLFDIAAKAGWVPNEKTLVHAGFGMMMTRVSETDKASKVVTKTVPFKTRDGDTIKLAELLDEAEQRAGVLFDRLQEERRQHTGDSASFTDAERAEIARVIGIASVKYNDLLHERTTDYVFDWDKMISMEGNTAAYMINAYVRVRGIARKGDIDYRALDTSADIQLGHESEVALAKILLNLGDVVHKVARDMTPHLLCNYLYDLARAFSAFYRDCKVLEAETPALRTSRLRLCDLTARTLRLGLSLLGIPVLERM